MSSEDALIPIRKTLESLDNIQARLAPHLQILQEQKKCSSTSSDKNEVVQSKEVLRHVKAEAQAAIALTLGTLLYMDSKLHGDSQSKVELSKTRQLIEVLRKVDPRSKEVTTVSTEENNLQCTKKEIISESKDESTNIRHTGSTEEERSSVTATQSESKSIDKKRKRKR